MQNILQVQNVEKYYGSKTNITKALNNVSFSVEEGEFIGIMGQSGSGKTTLLNCISTIDRVTSGHIAIDNSEITSMGSGALSRFRREKLGFVFQDFNLLDTLTCYENIALALTILKTKANEIKTRVASVSRQLGIEGVLEKYPYQISGGQKQRVACARALVTNPALILADEPTGALDSKSSYMLLDSLQKMNTEYGATILMVTHDAFTASYANKIYFLQDGKIFTELVKGADTREQFFKRIIEVVALMGGENSHVF